MYVTVGLAVLLLLLGKFLKVKVYFFRKYAVLSPVIGGLLFALTALALHSSEIVFLRFDNVLQAFFMTVFFTSIGFNVSLKLLSKGGAVLLIFLGLATIFSLLQNLVAIGLAKPLNLSPQLAMMTGSTALMGSRLALPLMVLLLAQVVLMYVFPRFVAFPAMGRNYDSAVSTSGLIGFAMGSTANAMANLDSICDKFGYSRVAYFIVPVVGAFFIDFINVLMITGFLAFL